MIYQCISYRYTLVWQGCARNIVLLVTFSVTGEKGGNTASKKMENSAIFYSTVPLKTITFKPFVFIACFVRS